MAKRIAKNLLSQLYKYDCDGHLNLTRKKNYYLVHGMETCQTFKKDFQLAYVGENHILKRPAEAYESAWNSCESDKVVLLKDMNLQKLKVPCPKLKGPMTFFELSEER